jgi:hypothetical protein
VNTGFEKRLLAVWFALCAITVVSLWVGSQGGQVARVPSAAITVSAIVIALVKVRIIFREFMEVRHAPVLLSRLTDLWVVVTAVSLLGTYMVGMALSTG